MAIQRAIANAEGSGFRSPIYSDEDAEKVREVWQQIGTGGVFSDLDEKEYQKGGPYFDRPYTEWSEKVESYYGKEGLEYHPQAWEDENDLMRKCFMEEISHAQTNGRSLIVPLSISDAVKASRKNTNLGFPDVTSNWTGSTLSGYIGRSAKLLAGQSSHLYPFILFKRVQPGGPQPSDAKQRPVWGADHAETFAGIAVLRPLLEKLRYIKGYQHLLGIDPLEEELKMELPVWKHKFSLDLSSADANFTPRLIRLGLNAIGQLVVLPEGYLAQVMEYYTSGALLTPTGLIEGTHGMPSGVAFTNLLETLVFRMIARYALYSQGIERFGIYQNGDDGLYLTQTEVQTDKLAQSFAEFGSVVNEAKSLNAPDKCSYLQRHCWEEHQYQAVMSTSRMLVRILYGERDPGIAKTGLRPRDFWTLNTIVKLENCKRHPNFEKFIEFVRSGDEGRLNPSPVMDVNVTDFEGYNPVGGEVAESAGLNGFEVVRYLLSGKQNERGPRVEKVHP